MKHLLLFENFIKKEFSNHPKLIFNSFDITKKDIKKVIMSMDVSFDEGYTITKTIDDLWWKININYPLGFKNIPQTIKLFRYLEVSDEKKIRTQYPQYLGVHFVNNKEYINSDFLALIFAVGNGFIVEIETTKNQIDIYKTIENNLHYPNENEITLKEDAKIKILNIEKYKGEKVFSDY